MALNQWWRKLSRPSSSSRELTSRFWRKYALPLRLETLEERLAPDASFTGRTGDVIAADLRAQLGGAQFSLASTFTLVDPVSGANRAVNAAISPKGDWELSTADTGTPLGTIIFGDRASSAADAASLSSHLGFTPGQRVAAAGQERPATLTPPAKARLAEDTGLLLQVGSRSPILVTIAAAATSTNTTPAHLAADINAALAAQLPADLAGQVTVGAPAGSARLSLRNQSAEAVTVLSSGQFLSRGQFYFAPDTREAGPGLGFLGGQYADAYGGATSVSLTALQAAPTNGRLEGDVRFDLRLNRATYADVTVPRAATVDNASQQDLADDLVAAINAARGTPAATDLSGSVTADGRLQLTLTGAAGVPQLGFFHVTDLRGFQGRLLGSAVVGASSQAVEITVGPGFSTDGTHRVTAIGADDPATVGDERTARLLRAQQRLSFLGYPGGGGVGTNTPKTIPADGFLTDQTKWGIGLFSHAVYDNNPSDSELPLAEFTDKLGPSIVDTGALALSLINSEQAPTWMLIQLDREPGGGPPDPAVFDDPGNPHSGGRDHRYSTGWTAELFVAASESFRLPGQTAAFNDGYDNVNDLSTPRGGSHSPHATHRVGMDIDFEEPHTFERSTDDADVGKLGFSKGQQSARVALADAAYAPVTANTPVTWDVTLGATQAAVSFTLTPANTAATAAGRAALAKAIEKGLADAGFFASPKNKKASAIKVGVVEGRITLTHAAQAVSVAASAALGFTAAQTSAYRLVGAALGARSGATTFQFTLGTTTYVLTVANADLPVDTLAASLAGVLADAGAAGVSVDAVGNRLVLRAASSSMSISDGRQTNASRPWFADDRGSTAGILARLGFVSGQSGFGEVKAQAAAATGTAGSVAFVLTVTQAVNEAGGEPRLRTERYVLRLSGTGATPAAIQAQLQAALADANAPAGTTVAVVGNRLAFRLAGAQLTLTDGTGAVQATGLRAGVAVPVGTAPAAGDVATGRLIKQIHGDGFAVVAAAATGVPDGWREVTVEDFTENSAAAKLQEQAYKTAHLTITERVNYDRAPIGQVIQAFITAQTPSGAGTKQIHWNDPYFYGQGARDSASGAYFDLNNNSTRDVGEPAAFSPAISQRGGRDRITFATGHDGHLHIDVATPDLQATGALGAAQTQALRDGLQASTGYLEGVHDVGPFEAILAGIGRSFADFFGFQTGYDAAVVAPVLAYLNGTASPTIEGVTAALAASGALDLVNARVTPDGTALEFNLVYSPTRSLDDLTIDLGAGAAALGLSFSAGVDVEASAALDFAFGLDLRPGVPASELFYFRVEDFRFDARADGAVNASATFGAAGSLVSAAIVDGAFDLGASLRLGLTDPNADGRFTLGELLTADLASLVDVAADARLNVTLPLNVTAGDFNLSAFGTPVVTVRSDNLFHAPPDVSMDVRLTAQLKDAVLGALAELDATVGEVFDDARQTLETPLPGINKSLKDLLGLGDLPGAFRLRDLAAGYLEGFSYTGDDFPTVLGLIDQLSDRLPGRSSRLIDADQPGSAGRNFAGQDARTGNFRGFDFRGANLRGVNFSGADLTGADLTGADLTGAVLTGASLRGAKLNGANLLGANLTRAFAVGADFTQARIDLSTLAGGLLYDEATLFPGGTTVLTAYSDFAEIDLAPAFGWQGALRLFSAAAEDLDFSEYNFAGFDLSGLDLSGLSLRGVSLAGANLRGALLGGADLTGADLSDALAVGADFSAAVLDATTVLDGLLHDPASALDLLGLDLSAARLFGAGVSLVGLDLRGFDLSGLDFSGVGLAGLDLRGVNLSGARNLDLRGVADLFGVDLRGAAFDPEALAAGKNFLAGLDLRTARLDGLDLSGFDLSGADLRGAALQAARLLGVDLDEALLQGADLAGANLSGAINLGRAVYDSVTRGFDFAAAGAVLADLPAGFGFSAGGPAFRFSGGLDPVKKAVEFRLIADVDHVVEQSFSFGVGGAGDGLALLSVGLQGAGTLRAGLGLDADVFFGVDLGSLLTPQAPTAGSVYFGVNELSVGAGVAVTGLDLSADVGILEASVRGGVARLDGKVSADVLDPTPADGRITLAEVGSASIDFTATGALGIELPIQASLGGRLLFPDLALPTLIIQDGQLFDGVAPVVTTENFDQIKKFTNLTAADAAGMLRQVFELLLALGRDQALGTRVPFTGKTVGEVLDFGASFKRDVLDPLFVSGDAFEPDADNDGDFDLNFKGIQSLAQRVAAAAGIPVTINYDLDKSELTFAFGFGETFNLGSLPLDFGASLGGLAGVTTSGSLSATASISAGLTFGIDLDPSEGIEVTPPTFEPSSVALVAVELPDDATGNAVQVLRVENATTGTYRLTFGAETTGAIAFDAPATGAGSVEAALEALAGISDVTVGLAVAGTDRRYTITFADPASPPGLLLVDPDGDLVRGPGENGRLSAAAHFSVELFHPAAPGVPESPAGAVAVTVAADPSNATLDDLVADVQAALDAALVAAGLTPGFLDSGTIAAGASFVGAAPFARLSADLVFTVTAGGRTYGGQVRAVDVLDTDGSDDLSAAELTAAVDVGRLASALQAAIAKALQHSGAGVTVAVVADAGRLRLTPAGGDVAVRFRGPVAAEGGGGRVALSTPAERLSTDKLQPGIPVERRLEVTAAFADPAYQELGLLSAPTRFDGRVSHDVAFTLKVNGTDVPVTLLASATSGNDSLDDLVAQLQSAVGAALAAAGLAADLVTVSRIDPAGNRLRLLSKRFAVTSFSIDVPAAAPGGGPNGAVTALGFESGDGEPRRARATEFFLENVFLAGDVDFVANDVAAAATLGFLGLRAEGDGSISLDASFSLKDPLDGDGRLLPGVIASALGDGKFLFDASAVGGTLADPGTGFVDGRLAGGLTFSLDVDPAGAIRGLTELSASLDVRADSPNWLVAAPSLADPLGFGADDTALGGTPFVLGAAAAANGVLAGDVSFVLSQGAFRAVGLLRAADTVAFTTRGQLQAALQGAVNKALARLVSAGGAGGSVAVAVDAATGAVRLTGDAGLSVRGNVIKIDFDGPDLDAVLNRFKSLSFADVLDGLRVVVDFLRSLDGSGGVGGAVAAALDFKLPLIDRSVADLISIADDFGDALDAFAANPAGSLQALEALIRQRLGIPASVPDILSFNGLTGVVEFDLGFDSATALSRPFRLDLADAGLPAFLTDIVGVSASGTLGVTAGVDFDLRLGLDLDEKSFYLITGEDGTRLSASVSATGSDLDFSAKLGPFGLFVIDGSAGLSGGVEVVLDDDDGRLVLVSLGAGGPPSELGDLLSAVDVEVTGAASAELPLFIGTESFSVPIDFAGPNPGAENKLGVEIDLVKLVGGQPGDFGFDLPTFDFASFQTPSLFALLSDPGTLIDGLDRLLGTLQDALSGQVFGVELPLVGDLLADNPAARLIGNFRAELLEPLGRLLRENNATLDTLLGLIRGTLFDALQPLGLLRDGPDAGTDVSANDIRFRFLDAGGAETGNIFLADSLQFDFDLGQTKTFTAGEVAFDLGIPALGLGAGFTPLVTIDWSLHFGFGVDDDLGFYFVTDHAVGGAPADEMTVMVNVEFSPSAAAPAEVKGRLLFLAMALTDGVDMDGDGVLELSRIDSDGDGVPDKPAPVTDLNKEEFTRVYLQGSLDLREPSGDGRLTFSELVTSSPLDILHPEVEGGAILRAAATVDFSTLGEGLGDILPSIDAKLLVDFAIGANPAAGFEVMPPRVAFADISLDLGSFISEFAAPVLGKVADILEPLEWLIGPDGFLNKRIPLLSDLAGRKVTGKDLIVLFDPDNGPKVVAFLNFVEELLFLANLVDDAAAAGGSLKLNFGDLVLAGNFAGLGLINRPVGLNLPDLRSLNNLNHVALPPALPTPEYSAPVPSTTQRFTSGVSKPGSIEFNLLKADTVFKLLMGQPDVTIVTVELPEFGFDFFYRQEFPIIGPLVGTFAGGVSGGIDLGFGYDTRGLSQFLASGNPASLLSGFFLNDLDPGTGLDRPEAFLRAEIAVGAALSLGFASVGVEGGIRGGIDFNLADLDADGKIRFDELAANLVANGFNPLAVFDVEGFVELFLRAYFQIKLGFIKIKKTWEFARLRLFEFSIDFERPSQLATLTGDTLTLNIGPNAANRLRGNTQDISETINVKSHGGGVAVWSDQFNVPQGIGELRVFTGVKKIVVNGGAGDDVINLGGLTDPSVKVTVRGGDGNDSIVGGAGADELFGDGGLDTIEGRGGADVLRGGADRDTLDGGAGGDQLFGEDGNDTLNGGADADTIDGGRGDDTFVRSGEDVYKLFNFGSTETIDGTGLGDVLDFSGKAQSLTFFLRGDRIEVGLDLIPGRAGDAITDYNSRLTVTNPAGLRRIIGGDLVDTFRVTGTAGAVTLDGKKGNDRYVFQAGAGTITATVEDTGDAWNSDNLIEVLGTAGADAFTLTDAAVTFGGSTVSYVAPPADANVVQIRLAAGGGRDTIDVVSTATTVPVRVEGGGGDDLFRVGGGNLANLRAYALPGLNKAQSPQLGTTYGAGPLVLVGGSGHDSVVFDDAAAPAGRSGNLTAFREDRDGGLTVDIGVLSGLGMSLTARDPETGVTTTGAGRVEFEAFEAVDVRLGPNADSLTLGGDSVFGQLPVNRRQDAQGGRLVEFIHTIAGMTLVSGGGGADTVGVIATNVLDRDALDAGLGVLGATTLTPGGGGADERQQVTVSGAARGVGYFTLKYRFSETKPIAVGASAADVQAALASLNIIGKSGVGPAAPDNVQVSKSTNASNDDVYVITFVNDLGGLDVDPLLPRVTPLLIDGDAGGDQLNVQSVTQTTFFLGGADNDRVDLNVDALTRSPLTANGVNAVVTLDGEAGDDRYYLHLIGGSTRSLVNVFDSGTVGQDQAGAEVGLDALTVYGRDDVADRDLFLLRASASLNGLAFITRLNGGGNLERVNYNVNLESITVEGGAGDDEFYSDDTRAVITVNAGAGRDFVQVGQLYKTARTPLLAGVLEEDVFETAETTRGFLSNGISFQMTVNGGGDDDLFIVFRNLDVLNLNGQDGDDTFIIQAFALAGSQEDRRALTDLSGDAGADTIQYAVNAPVNINGGDGFDRVIVIGTEFGDDFVVTDRGVFGAGLNVNFINVEFVEVDGAEGDDRFFIQSTGAGFVTQVTGGLGTDFFNVNGPTPRNGVISNDLRGHSGVLSHNVVGGAGSAYDGAKVRGVSANVADNDEPAIVITPTGGSSQVFTGGGSDSYAVSLARAPLPGTSVTVTVVVPAGLVLLDDPNLVFTPADWFQPRVVRFKLDEDAEGVPDTVDILHSVKATDRITGVAGAGSVNGDFLADDEGLEAKLFLPAGFPLPVPGPGLPEGLRGAFVRIFDSKSNPEAVGQTRLILDTLVLSEDGELALILNKPWTVEPPFDARFEILFYSGVKVPNVRVSVFSADRADVIVEQSEGGTSVAEGAGAGGEDAIRVRLSKAPTGTVTVALTSTLVGGTAAGLNGQLRFFDAATGAEVTQLTFDGGNYDAFRTVRVAAFDDGVVEGFHKADLVLTAAGGGYAVSRAVVADLADDDAAGVRILESDGSTDVIEFAGAPAAGYPARDSYRVVLTKAPAAGETVTVNVVAEPTRTSRTGGLRTFIEQVEVSADGTTFGLTASLTFTAANWDVPQVVYVRALDDARVDGNEAQVFAPALDQVNSVQGPLFINGGPGDDRTGLLEREPVMLPGERNVKESLGAVSAATEATTAEPATITIDADDLDPALFGATAATFDPSDLVTYTVEITGGPAKNKSRIVRSAEVIDAARNLWRLTLDRPWFSPFTRNADVPTAASRYTLFATNPNLLVNEVEQADRLTVSDRDNVNSFDDPALAGENAFAVGRLFYDASPYGNAGAPLGKFRLTGLGMGGDRAIGGAIQPGGITLSGLEQIALSLGSGNNRFTVEDTPAGAFVTLDAGAGNDAVAVKKLSGHAVVNLGAGSDTLTVRNDANRLADLLGLLTVTGDVPRVGVERAASGSAAQGASVNAVDEIQQVTVDATGGTFTLGLGGAATGPLAYNASAADVRAALEALPAVGAGNVVVTRAGHVYRVRFVNGRGGRPIDLLTPGESRLTNGLGATDTLNLDDSGTASPTVGALTSSSLTGLSTRQVNEVQTLVLDATGGTFRLGFAGAQTTELPHDASAAAVQAALEALPGVGGGNVAVTRNDDVYVLRFQGELTNRDVAQVTVAANGLSRTREVPGGGTATVVGLPGLALVSTRVNGSDAPPVNDAQVLTVNATGGTYTLSLLDGRVVTGPIAADASAEAVRDALQRAIAAGDVAQSLKFDVTVEKVGNAYLIAFQGRLRQVDDGTGADFLVADTAALAGSVSIATRMDGVNYYGFEVVNVDLGSGHDVLSVQGTTAGSGGFAAAGGVAVTNVRLHGGDEQVFVSSNADMDFASLAGFDFLTGQLDDVKGALNLDVGGGRHRLLVSDEAAAAGDGAAVITEDASNLPAAPAALGLAANAEVWLTGLAPAGISYRAAADGDFFDGVSYWSGSGDDSLFIDATHTRGGQRTVTLLNTGLGNDRVAADVDAGEDGFFVLHTMGGAQSPAPAAVAAGFRDDDVVDASASTLPLIVFGGLGKDDLFAGQNKDVVFGDFGRVQYVDASGALVATYGFGGRGDVSSSLDVPARWILSRELVLGGGDILRGHHDEDVLVGGAAGDAIDGGSADDLIFGDAVRLERRAVDTSPLFRTLAGPTLYDAAGNPQVTGAERNDPDNTPAQSWAPYRIVELYHSAAIEAAGRNDFGDDYIAGGSEDDVVFGQLGDDVIQGDGSIAGWLAGAPVAASRPGGSLVLTPSFEAATDGDDYVEGGGGGDVIFGNLGQDDLIGGSSDLFSLTAQSLRPDGDDLIFGGAGTRVARNDPGGGSVDGHARDADMVLGDNGNIFRLVTAAGAYVTFNYDYYSPLKIIPRVVELLDYTRGGSAADTAGDDLLLGEAGDDVVHGMGGNDVLFGNGQDDDLYGEAGADRLYGGAGEDGALGDDGLIQTSRNGLTEPLHGVTAVNAQAEIRLPGPFTGAWVFITGRINKSAGTLAWEQGGHDVIYGGLGDDFLHGGAGNDGVSGAEAQAAFHTYAPQPDGDPLGYNPATRKLAAYDANNPLTKITGFFLNFDPVDAGGAKIEDGKDRLFGDLGHDWLVGGTMNDRLFGGKGDDVHNLDDNHDTAGGLNNRPDAEAFADRDFAYGGDGLDVLIANTGGDRMYDWGGEFNSYLVPFSPFGNPTVVRSPSPQVREFVLALGRESGADQRLTEPNGELGLFTPQDPEWQPNHGGPRDPQPGNTHARRDTQGGPEDDRGTALPLTGPGSGGSGSGNALDVGLATVYVATDPTDAGRNALYVGGTAGNDTIEVRRGATDARVRVVVNGVAAGEFDRDALDLRRVIVFANAGDDAVTVNDDLPAIATVLFGGDGNDTIRGGRGNNYIDGGAGNDLLYGNAGADVMVGGAGADRLEAAFGDDLLIASVYAYSEDYEAIDFLMGTWGSSLSYSQRQAALRAGNVNGLFGLSTATIFDDGVADVLRGVQGQDWFWVFLLDDHDKKGNEGVN